MSGPSYSIYEAKARFSELIRRVRERGESIVISYHGEPVAEIRPVPVRGEEKLDERIRRLEDGGVIIRATGPIECLNTVASRPGALRRFLEDRNG
jgi:prevent-host-death family protein